MADVIALHRVTSALDFNVGPEERHALELLRPLCGEEIAPINPNWLPTPKAKAA